jgi:Ca-activated chloride channel family protein
MTRFLQPEWLWLLALLPIVLLWRGRRGPVAAIEYSDVSLAREVARRGRSRIGLLIWLLPILAGALMIVGLARPQRAHGRTEVTANGIDIVLDLDVSGSMQALDFQIDNRRVNRKISSGSPWAAPTTARRSARPSRPASTDCA